MNRIGTGIAAALLALSATAAHAAKPVTAKPTADAPDGTAKLRHFRLTFVLTYANNQQPSQSFALDVPVLPDRPGTTSMHLAAGPAGQIEGSTQQNLECTDVHISATGLAAKISFSIDRVPLEHLPGIDEPLHNQMNLERKVDLTLGQPTVITEELQKKPVNKSGDAVADAQPAPPQITVTAAEM
jgi:hypothetical protein